MADECILASEHIRALLSGCPPNGGVPETFGAYRDCIATLHEAHAHGGLPRVREAWKELTRRHPGLAALASGETPSRAHRVRWTAKELLDAEFPPINWVVPHLIAEGLAILAGRPKLGKSWLALQIAQAVATGGRIFDWTVEQGDVLYIALEDSDRRLQNRMRLQHWSPTPNAIFYTAWKPLDAGGFDTLQEEMTSGGIRLVVIDTLSRALSGRRNQNEVGEMTMVFSRLQHLALEGRAAILLVDHHSKPKGMAPDPIDDLLGSTGKGAAADIVMGLYRKRGERGGTLNVVGRDLEEDKNLALDWDARLRCWQLRGDAAEVVQGTSQADILTAFATLGGMATTTQVAKHLGLDKGNVSREISELANKGRLERLEKEGRAQPYRLAMTHDRTERTNDNHHNCHYHYNHHNDTTIYLDE
jgi:predicted transcriptional regulator